MLLIEQALSELDYDINIDTLYEYNGRKVPRVTEILSKTIHEDYLMIWANSLGFRRIRYKDELNRAADIGTRAHNSIEEYIKFKIEDSENPAFLSFLLWWNDIHQNNTIRVIGEEETLTCQWYGGTYDLLLEINGKTYLVDFKTSNHVGFKYFLQISAYRYMIYLNKGINIDGAIILQVDKKTPMYEEYLLDFSIKEHYEFIEHCTKTFFSLVYAYYNTERTRELYKSIFK